MTVYISLDFVLGLAQQSISNLSVPIRLISIIQSREKSLSQSDHKIHSKMVKVEAKRPSVNRRGGGGGGDQRSSHNRLVKAYLLFKSF